MRVLFDTNVILDVVLNRAPFSREAGYLFDLVDAGRVEGLLTPTTLTTTAYFIERDRGRQVTKDKIRELVSRFEVATVGRAVVEDALALDVSDFEDAVLHEAARRAGADAITTRNEGDFGKGSLPVYRPEELVDLLQHSS